MKLINFHKKYHDSSFLGIKSSRNGSIIATSSGESFIRIFDVDNLGLKQKLRGKQLTFFDICY